MHCYLFIIILVKYKITNHQTANNFIDLKSKISCVNDDTNASVIFTAKMHALLLKRPMAGTIIVQCAC